MLAWLWVMINVAWLAQLAGGRALSPDACSARFDVQHDKIIRTEESREMGARYLSELDVGSRQECLRLCCETDACDVFVYEEKSGGSCYLFSCGPPEDFRCKFTSHGNFSSGVLALSRRLAELQDQERDAPPPPPPPPQLPHYRVVTTSTTSTPATTTTRRSHAPLVGGGRCSRYEFECGHGGGCIAVYNACDGVPQCADGSDEAPELRCPTPAVPAAPVPPPAPIVHTHPTTTTVRPMYQESVPAAVERMPMLEGGGSGDGAGAMGAGGERWPHRLVQQQPPRWYAEAGGRDTSINAGGHAGDGAGGGGSHIFSHKGGLLTDDNYPPYEPWPRRPTPPRHNTVLSPDERMVEGEGWGGEWGARRSWPVPPRADQETAYMNQRTMPELPPSYNNQQQTLRDSAKKGFNLQPLAPPAPPATPAPPETPRETHEQENSVKKQLQEKVPAPGPPARATPAPHRHYADDAHDGLSDHPPAAVLLLVLGVLMTAATGVMVACRAGAARRRLRRGKSPFAHDADYLVNGMYL